MERLIDANKLKASSDITNWDSPYGCSFKVIDSQPTVEAKQIRYGNWENIIEISIHNKLNEIEYTSETCSECKCKIEFKGTKQTIFDTYCPNCGAKMKK